MSLQFVLGGSGSGKTTWLYERLIRMSREDPDGRYFAIVPEQFTMQTQKEIVTLHPNHGVMNLDIVSFQRLAYRIFEELAVENPTILDDMGKSMVLRKVAAMRKRELPMFEGLLDKAGFIGQLKSMLSELYQYGISAEDLEAQADSLENNPLLEQKLRDLTVVYRGFAKYIEKRYITAEEILDVLCRVLPESRLIRDSVVTLDGYTGFTPVQYRIVELLLTYCRQVLVTVTIDPEASVYQERGEQDLFHMSRHTIRRLVRAAESLHVAREPDVVLNERPLPRFADSPALDFLERRLLRYGRKAYEGQQDSVRILEAKGPGREVEQAVQEIRRLVQREGFRYRDIAVIAGDMAAYGGKIRRQFEINGIPCFLDQKKGVMGNPLVELIRSALETVDQDFSYESVFRYLKTGMVTEDREMVCRAENYVIALGIRGHKRWSGRWELVYRGGEHINLEELNGFREEVLKPLADLREVMRDQSSTVLQKTGAVIRLLTGLRAEEQLLLCRSRFEEMGEYELAREYEQVYGLVMDLADRLAALLGDEVVGQKEYARILDAGFEELQVGLIPATVDRVVVGDIIRTRVDHVKALFFLGVNDGVVPCAKKAGGVLGDKERELLKSREIELAPTAKEDGFMQRFYLYLMMTKPSHKLYLSYSSASSEGKSLRPSFLIGTVKALFPKLEVERERQEVYSLESAKRQLIDGLLHIRSESGREEGESPCGRLGLAGRFPELYGWFMRSEEYRDLAGELVNAAFYSYEEHGIGRAAARALYGDVLSGSVTRLEQYASCAYAHFLKYGLELEERKEYELAAVDMGNLFHDSIDRFFKTMKEENRDWHRMTEEERKALVRSCVEDAVEEYGGRIMESSARNAYLARRVERITDRTVWALGEQIKKGDFVPAAFEVSFSARDDLKAMRIPLAEGEALHLRGRIDRLDLCEEEDQVYVKIIDYKSGSASFDLDSLYHGLQLQLVVYMDAVLELEGRKHPDKEVRPAGIFYYNIDDPLVEKSEDMGQEEIDGAILRKLRMNGLVNSRLDVIRHLDRTIETESDVIPVALKSGQVLEGRSSVAGDRRFSALREFVRERLQAAGREILDGETGINPYKQGNRTACDYCPYHPVCGFDLKSSGYRFRRFKGLKTEEIWKEIEGGEDGDEVDG